MAKITDYRPLPNNPNKGTQKGVGAIEQSVRQLGAGRSILVDKDGVIIAGNHAQEAFVNAGIDDVIEVETDGSQIVVVKRTDMSADSAEGKRMSIMDNRAGELGLAWDDVIVEEILQDIQEQEGEVDRWLSELAEEQGITENEYQGHENEETVEDDDILYLERPDAIFPSSNEFGIPDLRLSYQAKFVEPPIVRWGRFSRHNSANYAAMFHFYTDDYKFSALWKDPTPLVISGCKSVIEPNISLCREYPLARVLWEVYKKRWLSCYLGNYNIGVIVDLNVPQEFDEINLLGVPDGWGAYSTRHYAEFGTDELDRQFALAAQKAQSEDIIFMICGGGSNVKEYCNLKGWHHIDFITEVNHG